jgi:23S rRNA (pseudouridine1915-N3)-methyltransferase
LDSLRFAEVLKEKLDHSQKVLIIIGGAFGVTAELRGRAHLVWSLSPLVFPHQLVRLMLTEQLYRAQQITLGGAYHHQ